MRSTPFPFVSRGQTAAPPFASRGQTAAPPFASRRQPLVRRGRTPLAAIATSDPRGVIVRSAAIALLTGAALAPSAIHAQTPAPAGGCWIGTVGSAGSARHAVLELPRSDSEGPGEFTVLGRNAEPRPIANIVRGVGLLLFQTDRTGDSEPRRAALALDGGSLAGWLVSGTDSTRAAFTRLERPAAPDTGLLGVWRGILDAGFPLTIVLRFRSAPCGQTHLVMDSPDQGAADLPATALQLAGDSVRFEMAYMEGAFVGALDRRAGVIAGTWTQRGMAMPLRVERTTAADPSGRPQDPRPPLPYRSEEVTYESAPSGIDLSGTLTLPPGDGPFPAVLLLSGSGAQDRDETIAGHRPFLVIADHLTRAGIAVLRVDDRGVGGSTGNVMTATIEDNASDALAGVEYLRTRPEIDVRRIGLIGHSEGGYVAPLAASQSDDIGFVILLAGPAVPSRELLLAQQEALARAGGEAAEIGDARRTVTNALFDVLEREPADSLARLRMQEAAARLFRDASGRRREVLDSLYRNRGEESLDVMLTPWFRYLLAYDPGPALRTLRVPVLALYGERDLQVPAQQSVRALEQLRMSGLRAPVTVRVFPELNHLFQTATTGLPAEYIRIEETIAPVVLDTMADWIAALNGLSHERRP